MARIVLAHGILGLGSVFPKQSLNYFNGVKELYEEDHHHEVHCPTVLALGSLEERSRELALQVASYWPDDGQRNIYLLAHSMGGLDCRRMLARWPDIAKRVKRLITIATPHYGSPVADAVLKRGPFGLPNPAQILVDTFGGVAGALKDLKTRGALQDGKVDRKVDGVEYLCVGCNAGSISPSFFFSKTALLGGFGSKPNDGVVGLASSSRTNDAADLTDRWAVDHGGAIGWPTGSAEELVEAGITPPPEHLARYEALLKPLLGV